MCEISRGLGTRTCTCEDLDSQDELSSTVQPVLPPLIGINMTDEVACPRGYGQLPEIKNVQKFLFYRIRMCEMFLYKRQTKLCWIENVSIRGHRKRLYLKSGFHRQFNHNRTCFISYSWRIEFRSEFRRLIRKSKHSKAVKHEKKNNINILVRSWRHQVTVVDEGWPHTTKYNELLALRGRILVLSGSRNERGAAL